MTTNDTPPDWMTDERLRSMTNAPKAPLVGPYAREILRLRALIPPTARGISNGPGEGSWSVFAEKAVAERDAARAEVERLKNAEANAQAMGRQAQDDLVAARAELAKATAERTRPDRVVRHDHATGGGVTYANCIGCIADERDAETVRADSAEDQLRGCRDRVMSIGVERDAYRAALAEVTSERDATEARFQVAWGECAKANTERDAARAEVERLSAERQDAMQVRVSLEADLRAAIRDRHEFAASEVERFWGLGVAKRAAELRKAGGGDSDEAWLKAPLTPREEALCDLTGRKLESWDEAFKDAAPICTSSPADLHQPAADLHQLVTEKVNAMRERIAGVDEKIADAWAHMEREKERRAIPCLIEAVQRLTAAIAAERAGGA